MNKEQITLERFKMAILITKALRDEGYDFDEVFEGDHVTWNVRHFSVPSWHRFVNISEFQGPESSDSINLLTVPTDFKSTNMSTLTVRRMVTKLNEMRDNVGRIVQSSAELEATAAKYEQIQRDDLEDVVIPGCMNVRINYRGEKAGTYEVRFDAGSLMEHLSDDQVVELAELIRKFEDK